VLGIRGGAAVAEGEQLSAGRERPNQPAAYAAEVGGVLGEEALLQTPPGE
jgi:hypothetical protein